MADLQARHSVLEEESSTLPQDVLANWRRTHAFKLSRLVPGAVSTIAAMYDDVGNVVTGVDDMARLLSCNWERVFSDKGTDDAKLNEWLSDADRDSWFPRIQPAPIDLQIEHIQQAVTYAKDSAPGPDGLPYVAYSCYPPIQEVLLDAGRGLLDDGDPEVPDGFNDAYLCCLGKKPAATTHEHGDI